MGNDNFWREDSVQFNVVGGEEKTHLIKEDCNFFV